MTSVDHFGFSKIPVNPSFRSAAVNAIAVVPLLSHDKDGEATDSHSAKSFHDLIDALRRHNKASKGSAKTKEVMLIVPNNSLTRPGDWRYSDTPLKAFHWQHGCQRLLIHDGRPENSRHARDRLMNSATRDWIDLCPSRRTAAVVGVLNMHDCKDINDVNRACEELNQWAVRYSTPPYEATAHGHSFERDRPVQRLFVYDSFDEENQKIDLSQSKMGNSILAFPPADDAHQQMMELHLNVVVSDLTVAVFRDLEQKIMESNDLGLSTKEQQQAPANQGLTRSALSRYISGSSGDAIEDEPMKNSKNLGISQMAGLVNPNSKLAKETPTSSGTTSRKNSFGSAPISDTSSGGGNGGGTTRQQELKGTSNKLPQLMTPLDDDDPTDDMAHMSGKDVDAIRKRDIGRREKFNADLCLLAGSPLDAYERYLRAAEHCKSGTLDPLWHASALEGCAAAHIAMAETGGYSVDDYLENNFQLPEEIMALAREDANKRLTVNPNKQTLPEVVFALCEEALNILDRHKKLSHLYAELLVKLASYCAEEAETHLRCRWGEGDFCYEGEPGEPPRWERTTISKLKFNPLKGKDGDMIAINTHIRTKKVCELLSTAASVDGLDPATRVDVSTRCASICYKGVMPTRWDGRASERVTLFRKAAFFTVIAAETASIATTNDKIKTASDLWLLASQLYNKNRNTTDGGGDYGWATLRAFCYDCLSLQGNNEISLMAASQLLSLLGDLQPSMEDDSSRRSGRKSEEDDDAVFSGTEGGAKDADKKRTSTMNTDDNNDLQQAVSTASQFAKNLRASYTNFTTASPILAQQSKWASDDPVPSLEVPLSDSSPLAPSLIRLRSVWSDMNHETCAAAQKRCLDRMSALQRAIPMSSESGIDLGALYGFSGDSIPLYVSSAMTIQSEASLELECVRLRKKSSETSEGAMATFFNPYANKKTDENAATRVAEDEERAMMIKFANKLSLPLEVQRSQLVFDSNAKKRVKAAALSFVVPPNASDFVVHFPFTVLSKSSIAENLEEEEKNEVFEVTGLNLTCFGRSFFLPIGALNNTSAPHANNNLPVSASNYPYAVHKTENSNRKQQKPRIESFPSQPKLRISFADTGSPAETISASLSDGEILILPVLRLENDLGPSSIGKIERLEINVVGFQDSKLFDSSQSCGDGQHEAQFVHELIHNDNPPPFKIRALDCSLDLGHINNSKFGDVNKGNELTMQIAAAHNLGERFKDGTSIIIRFRYRGPCKTETEVWRKKDVTIEISHLKGPRISSVTFRPDLDKLSAFAEFNKKNIAFAPGVRGKQMSEESKMNDVTERIALDQTTGICSNNFIFILTVANDTKSVIKVSREGDSTFGLEGCSLRDMIVRPVVSAKIPIIMPRMHRSDSSGNASDVASQFVESTSLIWEMLKGGEGGLIKARGRIRIPLSCLNDIIKKCPGVLSQMCTPPCKMSLSVHGQPASSEAISVSMGTPIKVSVEVSIESWLPDEIAKDCKISLQLCCTSKDNVETSNQVRRDHVWAGKNRRVFTMAESGNKLHTGIVAFCARGQFVISACAKITRISMENRSEKTEEVWWAPVAQVVNVIEVDSPAQ